MKETIILEPTSPTTHFAFKPPPHNYVDSQGNVVVETAPEGSRAKENDRIRLDRFQHIPGSLVCRGRLGHVKVRSKSAHRTSRYDRMAGRVPEAHRGQTALTRSPALRFETVLYQPFGQLMSNRDRPIPIEMA